MASVKESFFHFAHSVSSIGVGLFHAILSVLYAVLGFAQELMTGIIRLGQALVELVLNLVQSALGFVLANFFVIAILGGGYYWYTRRQRGGGRKKRV